jgi:hypothetical protein
MIKNIPNKYSIAVLGDEIDTTHENEYDFLYLPFDQNVQFRIFRVNVIWDMLLSTLLLPKV